MKKKHRKRTALRLICLILCVLMLVPAVCSCKNEQKDETVTDTVSSDEVLYKLSQFTIVRSDDASKYISDAVVAFQSAIKNSIGATLDIKTDLLAKYELPCEILIGTDKREIYNEAMKDVSENGYIIRTVSTDDGKKIIIGANNDIVLLEAMRGFEKMLADGAVVGNDGYVSKLDVSNTGSVVLQEDKVKQLSFICAKGLDANLNAAISLFAGEIRTKYGSRPEIVTVDSTADISKYPYAIVIGSAGKEATALQGGLTAETTYRVKIENSTDSFRAYLVGANATATLRALQYFYTASVINGELMIPLSLDATVTPHRVRDPFILTYNNKYYLYENAGDKGYRVRTSTDLYNWSAPKDIYTFSGNAESYKTWAPECHYYNGNFYLIASYHSETTGYRGVGVFKSNKPDGQFELISRNSATATSVGHITAGNRNIIDGTLYIDDEGKPWMIYSNEWDKTKFQAGNRKWIGSLAYAPMSDDLTHFIDDPKVMFEADAAPWSNYGICEAPWMYKCEDGTLLMLWSNNTDQGTYSVGVAKSSNGRLNGEWTHYTTPLFTADNSNIYCRIAGGHGMIFKSLDGRMYLSVHTPNNDKSNLGLTLIPIVESEGAIRVDSIKK